jgi:carbamoyl-phosphate synthase large subunit
MAQMNILLTSVGRRTYMIQYFKEALHGRGLVYASNSIDTYSLHCADKYVLTPQIYDDNYVDFLIEYCLNNSIKAIISLFDIDLPILSKNSDRFHSNGIKLIISDYQVTSICNDKWATYNFLVRIGLRQPATFVSLLEAKDCLKNQVVHYPLFLKPRWGMGSIGIYKANNDRELEVLYSKLHEEIFGTYLKFESCADVNSCIIMQEAINGSEYGIEILNDLQCNYITTFAKQKLAMRAGETDIAKTVDPTPFLDIARNISSNLRHRAMLDVDCFITEDGDVVVLEMNCRFGGQYPFTHNAGVNVPAQIINWLENNDTDMTLLTQQNNVLSCKELVPTIFYRN